MSCPYRSHMTVHRGSRAQAELEKLLQGRPNFTVHTPKGLVASALWDYGEDALAERALAMSEEQRVKIDKISAWYEQPDYLLPMTGQRITHNHVAAFAAITFFEGQVRPLARTRRRPAKDRPAKFER